MNNRSGNAVPRRKKKKERKEEEKRERKNASAFVHRGKKKKRKKGAKGSRANQLHRGSCPSCRCSCAPHSSNLILLLLPPPPHGPVSFSRNILHREGSEKENRLEWLIREERAECVCKSFKRPVKKLHWRPASAVKHKANYRLNIFRYILSCRDRRGLRSLFFDLNHPLLAPILPFSFAARVATPDDEPDEHDRGSLSTTIDETERYIQGPSSTLPSFPRLLPS